LHTPAWSSRFRREAAARTTRGGSSISAASLDWRSSVVVECPECVYFEAWRAIGRFGGRGSWASGRPGKGQRAEGRASGCSPDLQKRSQVCEGELSEGLGLGRLGLRAPQVGTCRARVMAANGGLAAASFASHPMPTHEELPTGSAESSRGEGGVRRRLA
jgi:hypothetical protein